MLNRPNTTLNASLLALSLQDLPGERLVQGESRAGATPIGEFSGLSYGVWEITPGISRDIEVSELFIVLSGRATVSFEDGTPPMQLEPGSIAQLADGAKTLWDVRETLRKVYFIDQA